ncbi:MAG TPA: PAS domain-containing protein [Patescibacteria group bacterium]
MPDQLEQIVVDWKSMFEKMNIGFSVQKLFWDQDGNPVDIEYEDINPAFEKITGIKREQAIGHRTSELIPDLEKEVYDYYGQVVRTGNPVTFEQMVKGLGVVFKVYAFKTGENEFGTIFEDITQSQHEKEFREQEAALLNAFINSMSDYVFYKNKEGVYVICNLAFAKEYVGKPIQSIIGKSDQEIFGASDVDKLGFILSKDKEVFESGATVKADWITKLSDGRIVTLETVKTPFRDKDGNLLGLVGVSRDITDRVNSEKAINEQLRELQVMNRLMIDRELKMIELKKALEKHRNEPVKKPE